MNFIIDDCHFFYRNIRFYVVLKTVFEALFNYLIRVHQTTGNTLAINVCVLTGFESRSGYSSMPLFEENSLKCIIKLIQYYFYGYIYFVCKVFRAPTYVF